MLSSLPVFIAHLVSPYRRVLSTGIPVSAIPVSAASIKNYSYTTNNIHHAFDIVNSTYISEYSLEAHLLSHKKTKAQVYFSNIKILDLR